MELRPLSFTILLLFIISHTVHANFKMPNLEALKWPKDRVTDQVKLLPFAQELKLNHFLQTLKDKENLTLYFYFTPSLEGLDLEEKASTILRESLEDEEASDGVLFFLSLSDRKFKIHTQGTVAEQVSDEDLAYLVKSTVPYLSQQNYAGAIGSFLSNFLFKLKGNNSYKVPKLGLNKSYNLNSLLFFLIGAVLVFMLGIKVRKGPKVLTKDPGLVKKKTSDMAIFW